MPIEYHRDEVQSLGEVIEFYHRGFHFGRLQPIRQGGWAWTLRSSFGDAILLQPWSGVVEIHEHARTAIESAWKRFLDLAELKDAD